MTCSPDTLNNCIPLQVDRLEKTMSTYINIGSDFASACRTSLFLVAEKCLLTVQLSRDRSLFRV